MKKLSLLIILFLSTSIVANAQFDFKDRLKKKLEDAANRKIDRTMDKAVNKSEEKLDKTVNQTLEGKEKEDNRNGVAAAMSAMSKTTKGDIAEFRLPTAYKITYSIQDGKNIIPIDLYLDANSADYAMGIKEQKQKETFYSIFKESNKTFYMIATGYVMSYNFGAFQQSGLSKTLSEDDLMKYQLKPTGATETIAGYPCKELAGQAEDGSKFNVWVAYGIKSGSNLMPGAKYNPNEKATYKKLYGSSDLGFFLKAVTTDPDGKVTTMTATKVETKPQEIVIQTSNHQFMDASNMLNMMAPKN